MEKYYNFDSQAIEDALHAAKENHADLDLETTNAQFDTSKGGDLVVRAQCIAVKVENNKVCLELPFGLGSHCLTLPVNIPNGTVGKACLDICTTWGIPTGVKVSVVIGGITVISQTFGKC